MFALDVLDIETVYNVDPIFTTIILFQMILIPDLNFNLFHFLVILIMQLSTSFLFFCFIVGHIYKIRSLIWNFLRCWFSLFLLGHLIIVNILNGGSFFAFHHYYQLIISILLFQILISFIVRFHNTPISLQFS